MKTSDKIKVKACRIICKDHPEWGTFGVSHDNGSYFNIFNHSGARILSRSEADNKWEVVSSHCLFDEVTGTHNIFKTE